MFLMSDNLKILSNPESIIQIDKNRHIPLDGAVNFRDLGGYPADDGRRMKWGLLYRSGHLARLTDSDLRLLEGLGLKKVTDFRGPVEKEDEPNRLPSNTVCSEHPVDVAGTDIQKEVRSLILGKSELTAEDYLTGVNHLFVREYTPVFRSWLHDLKDNPDSVPQVFHCTAGKDRTGFAAALILRILGVAPEIAMEDYLLSRKYMADSIDEIVNHISKKAPGNNAGERVRPLLGIEEAYLNAAFGAIEEDWGDFDSYVREGLELNEDDIEEMKSRFLE